MKRAVVILADGFEEIEALAPVDILRRAGVEVILAGLTALEQVSARGVRVGCDRFLSAVSGSAGDFDAVILPGGGRGAENLAASPEVLAFVASLHARNKVVAAISASPALVLAGTGILDRRSATCYPGMERHFTALTKFSEEPVVVDGHIVTSRGAGTSVAFSLVLVELLVDRAAREKIARAILAAG